MSVDRQWLIDALTDALETLSETVERLEDERLDAEEVLNKSVRGVVVQKNSIGGFAYNYQDVESRVFQKRHYYMPFTRQEVINSGGTLTQNPEYN